MLGRGQVSVAWLLDGYDGCRDALTSFAELVELLVGGY